MSHFYSACGSIYTYTKGDRSWKDENGNDTIINAGPIPRVIDLDEAENNPLKGFFDCVIKRADTGKECLITIQATPDLICYGCDDKLSGVSINDAMIKKIKIELEIESLEDSDYIAEVICYAMNDGEQLIGDDLTLNLNDDYDTETIFEWILK